MFCCTYLCVEASDFRDALGTNVNVKAAHTLYAVSIGAEVETRAPLIADAMFWKAAALKQPTHSYIQ